MIRQDAIEFTILDEDDWQFEDIGDEIEYFSFEDNVVAVDSPFSLIAKHIGIFAIFGLSLILVIFLCIIICLKILDIDASQAVSKPPQTATYAIEHKKGKDVNSAELIDISKIVSGYMYVLSQSDLYADLNNFCENGSNVYEKIIEIQGESKFAYDKSDSFVRACKTLAKKTTIGKISEAVEKDGKYYCYVDLIVPNSQALRAYMLGYSYEVTKQTGRVKLILLRLAVM